MKLQLFGFFIICCHFGLAQSVSKPPSAINFAACTTSECKIRNSFITSEYYLDSDDIDASQKWLNITKDLLNPEKIDSTHCYVHSMQSELFYYNGLFQFGKNEARKQIGLAKKIKDSLMISDAYFFLAINQMELGEHQDAQKALWSCRDFYPKRKLKKRMRSIIQNEHIYNNLAQVKLRLHQSDSAFWYNKKAYQFALKANSRRGIPNVEQSFGEIYLMQKKNDSAAFYFKKSVLSAYKSQYYDIVLVNDAFLMECYKDKPAFRKSYYNDGLILMKHHIVNATFRKLFFTRALHVYQGLDAEKTMEIQQKIIEMDAKTQARGNLYFQNFTDQYIRNEKKLLSLEVQKLKRQKDIVIFQLLIAILVVILLALAVMYIRRKNKINSTLLDQKNEISKDLHDDIGSGISSILIHSDLLQKTAETNEKQKLLLSKISLTAQEVSQRINTFIWSLNAENNTLRDFMEYLKLYAENLFEGTPLELEFIEDEESHKHFLLDGKTRKNLFFSIKEIFNNALKHSNADKITIMVSIVEKKNLFIRIQDNGGGISGQNYFGNGLKNLQKRVEEMNGTITMETKNGLSTSIIIPLSE
ncbi:ATP-binding protein [Flavobacterium wongokense]|uniref:ATP-binding protein n=1 Tax=Flavobacterium wongokense TaxID=2910674 RepID=UPI001F463ED0|nr:ATP-binding protein [Flavobacterium sp. WG47]MCF6131140.1 histidine kinase [Flavobacterium sp. WG47]